MVNFDSKYTFIFWRQCKTKIHTKFSPEAAPVRNLDKRSNPYRPFSEGTTDNIEYRRFPTIKTAAAESPIGLIF